MTDSIKNKRTNETLRSLEFDLDVILSDENNEHAPPILPRIIAADDQQTLSTLDRDQSLLTQDEPPPFVISRPTHERRHERFVDEEAPSRPRVHDYSSTLEKEVDGKGIDEVEEDRRGPFSFRELYVAAFIMSLVLLAVITGLAIWFITVKMGDQEQVHANPNIRAETDDDFAWIPLTPSPMTPPPSTLVTLTPLTPVPSVAATDAVISPSSSPTLRPAVATPPPTTSRPTPSPSAAPTDESVAIQQARARFLTILEERSPTLLQTLQEPESTHFQALEWLIRDPDFFTYSPNRVIQRWVLALFALGLSSWDSLQQLKQTGLPPQLQTWVQYTNECSWFFSQVDSSDVLCNNQGEYVRLDLRDMNLAGTIPSELSLLSNSLEFIFLFDNEFYGTIPTQLGLLHRLQRLELTRNSLDGTIPTQIGQLANLVFLGLGRNDLTGPLPSQLGQLGRLRTLGLERNLFSSTIPAQFGNMLETRVLNLDRNELSGSIPTTLERLSRLERMNLSFNSLQGSIPDGICNVQGLELLEADCSDVGCPCCTTCNYFY